MKNLMKKGLIAALGVSALALSACNGGGGGGSVVIYDPYVYAWYDVYGNGCSFDYPAPGCNYYYNSYGDLIKIMDFEDPYFTSDYYYLEYNTYYFTLQGVSYYYTGWAWVSPTGIIYDEYGNALNSKKSRNRDIVADVGAAQNKVVEEVGKKFAAKYQLDEQKGVQIARVLNEWANLGKDRAKTEKDIAEFSQKLYGLDYNKVKSALLEAQKGNEAAMKEAISDAAANWGTNEENMKEILKSWYRGVPGLE